MALQTSKVLKWAFSTMFSNDILTKWFLKILKQDFVDVFQLFRLFVHFFRGFWDKTKRVSLWRMIAKFDSVCIVPSDVQSIIGDLKMETVYISKTLTQVCFCQVLFEKGRHFICSEDVALLTSPTTGKQVKPEYRLVT